MSAIKAVIFDKDGTLHDTEKIFVKAWGLAAEELSVPDIESTVQDCTGMPLQDIARYWAVKYPTIPFEDYISRRQFHFKRLTADGVPVKPHAHRVLATLRERGYRIGMATSTGAAGALEHLRRTDMLGYFDEGVVITGDMVERGKPSPDIFLLCAERLGVAPDEVIGVEDSANGVRAIHAAGMRAVMIPDIVQPTDELLSLAWRRCDDLEELLAFPELGGC